MATAASNWMTARDREGSFERLFMEEYARIVAIAYRVVADSHEAEDVAQEVFCSFYRQHAPDAPYAAAWLRRAAVHTALNTIRGKRRRKQRETLEARSQERVQTHAGEGLDPLDAAERAEQQQEVRAALAHLPSRSAAVLVLRYSGLSYAEVAEVLGVGIGQVGTLLRRAEAALRKELEHATPR